MKRLWHAFFHSLEGFKAAWRDEAAFRQEIMLAILAIPAAFWLAPDKLWCALMVVSIINVLVVELLNTAIEAAIDRHGGEIHPLSKKAKDCGSAAVLMALILTAILWIAALT